jgi:hypothetical protein
MFQVSIGIIDANPSTTKGVIHVLDELEKVLPCDWFTMTLLITGNLNAVCAEVQSDSLARRPAVC